MPIRGRGPRDAMLIGGVRTPFGRRGGALSAIRADDLAAHVLRAALDATQVSAESVEDVIFGAVTQIGEQGLNVARVALLKAGLPVDVPGVAINRFCGSSLQAAHFAASAIRADDMDVVLTGGVESMSRIPMLSDAPGFPSVPGHTLLPMGLSAERIATAWDISRKEMEDFALRSHQRAVAARASGRLGREIVPVPVTSESGGHVDVTEDECPRRETSAEKLAGLAPAFAVDGRLTAGTSSAISDGAGAALLTSRAWAKRQGVRPKARLIAQAAVGVDTEMQLTGIIPATRKVLARTGLSLHDMDVIEVNEAFASVVIAWLRELGPVDETRLNPNGGAIALGHPLGASGVRLLLTAIEELERRGGEFALVTLCIGLGMGVASVWQREDA